MGNCANSKRQKQEQNFEISVSDYSVSDCEDDFMNAKDLHLYKYVVKSDLKKKDKIEGKVMKKPVVVYLPYDKKSIKRKQKEKEKENQVKKPEFSKSVSLVTGLRFSYRYND